VKEREKTKKTLRFNLLGSKVDLASSMREVHCALAELSSSSRECERGLFLEKRQRESEELEGVLGVPY